MGQINLLIDAINDIVNNTDINKKSPKYILEQFIGENGNNRYKMESQFLEDLGEYGEKEEFLIFQRDEIEEVKTVPNLSSSILLDHQPYSESIFEVSYADTEITLTQVSSLDKLTSPGLFYPDIQNSLIFFHEDEIGSQVRIYYWIDAYKFVTAKQVLHIIETIREKRENNEEITTADYEIAIADLRRYGYHIEKLTEILKVIYDDIEEMSNRIANLNIIERLKELRLTVSLLNKKLKEDISLLPLFLSKFVKKIYDVKN